MRRIQLFPAAFYLLTLPVSVAANDWTWTITPYAFLADVHVDVKHNDEQIISSDITLSDLIDDLESAVIFHVEGKGDRHVFQTICREGGRIRYAEYLIRPV